MNDRADPAGDQSGFAALGRVVRERRRGLGLHQRELANLADCSTRFVHLLERGKPTVRLDKLLDVLRVLGLGITVRPGDGDVTVDDGR